MDTRLRRNEAVWYPRQAFHIQLNSMESENLQEIFDRMQVTKKDLKEIKGTYRDVLKGLQAYQDVVDELDKLKAKKKQMEEELKNDSATDFAKMETLSLDIKTDQELLSDLSFNKIVAGEQIEVVDGQQNRYEPVITVRFKKTG